LESDLELERTWTWDDERLMSMNGWMRWDEMMDDDE
jgi:hypothetical protein